METAQILLVTKDKKRSAFDLSWVSRENSNWQLELETVGSGWEALDRVQAGSGPGPGLVLLDMMEGDSDGLHSLRWLRRIRPDLPVILLTRSDNPQDKLEAIRLGAQD